MEINLDTFKLGLDTIFTIGGFLVAVGLLLWKVSNRMATDQAQTAASFVALESQINQKLEMIEGKLGQTFAGTLKEMMAEERHRVETRFQGQDEKFSKLFERERLHDQQLAKITEILKGLPDAKMVNEISLSIGKLDAGQSQLSKSVDMIHESLIRERESHSAIIMSDMKKGSKQ